MPAACGASAASAARLFFPADASFPLPAERQSNRLRKTLSEIGGRCEFRDGVDPLKTLGIRTSFKTIERVSERVGAEVARDKFGPLARAGAPEEAPANAAELLVLEGDGLRVRELADTADTAGADTEDRLSGAVDEVSEADRANGWREAKVGVVARVRPGWTNDEGEYHEPETLVQTYVGTMEDINSFAEKLRAEAERRGALKAKVVIALSDAGHGLPNMWEATFGDVIVVWVIDFYHVSSRLAECANAVLEGSDARKLCHRWKSMLYKGQAGKLLRELIRRAEEFADRPERASDLPEESPGRILWEHALYIERYQYHMRYDEYRAKGWPIASGHVEAFAKHIGTRMKAASKRWKPVVGSEAMVNLLADQASQDGRWQRRWPDDPVPLEKLGST